ncbi:hypothetical protein Scep_004348 [Stephania cephalantha]|uniref:Uncharacterized protein n=1 Tax=Stephania cephalantha TaxID=152367 RepID=A0AAP0KTY0_9MAGN
MGFFGYMLKPKEGKGLGVIFSSDMRSYDIAFMHGSDVTMLVIVAYLGIVELHG